MQISFIMYFFCLAVAQEESCGCSSLDRADFEVSSLEKSTCLDESISDAPKVSTEIGSEMVFVEGGMFHMGLERALIPTVCD